MGGEGEGNGGEGKEKWGLGPPVHPLIYRDKQISLYLQAIS